MKRSFGFAQDDVLRYAQDEVEGGFVRNGGLDEGATALASSDGASPTLRAIFGCGYAALGSLWPNRQIDWMNPVCYHRRESRSPSFSPCSRPTCSPGQQDKDSYVSLRLRANALGRFFISRARHYR